MLSMPIKAGTTIKDHNLNYLLQHLNQCYS